VFATEEDYANERARWGLDKPLIVQYGLFITNAARGDFGKSIKTGIPVSELISGKLVNSAKLVGVGLLMAIVISLPLAVVAAVRKGSFWDILARVIAGLGQAMPSFWLGLMLMYIFALKLKWLPATGMGGIGHYIMPAFVTALFLIAGFIRLLRSSMLDVLGSEYIKLARIKGLPEYIVIWKHALRNSLLPVLGFGGVYVAVCVTTSIMVEVVFAWPGFGRLVYEAIMARDYPLMQGVVMVGSAIVMMANLIVDILYAYFDPRIRY
jgi:peptide/nickel transport system permease protein